MNRFQTMLSKLSFLVNLNMNPKLIILLLFLFHQNLFSQQNKAIVLHLKKASLSSSLDIIEQKFNVKYNYLDSLLIDKKIDLPKRKYTLVQIHTAIESQLELEFTKIEDGIYSISFAEEAVYNEVEILSEVIVQSYITQGLNKQLGKTVLYPNKFEILPGVTDADVLLILQQLPGVISPHETASGLNVRGGKIDQNLVLWDDIRIYHQGHLFGMISPFNPDATDKVNFYFKGTHPKFGERISSIIDLKTSEAIPDQAHIKAGINGLNADFKLHIPLVSNTLSIEISGRKSYTQWWNSPTFNQFSKKVFQNSAFTDFTSSNTFGYEDYAAKLNFKLREKTALYFSGLFIDNLLNFSTPLESSGTKIDEMQIQNYGFSGKWNEKWNENWNHLLQINYSNYNFISNNQKNKDATFENFSKQNAIEDYEIEWMLHHRHSEYWQLELGYQGLHQKANHAFVVATSNYILDLDHKNSQNTTHSSFLHSINQWKSWTMQSGLRFSFFQTLDAYALEPRLLLQNKLSNHWSLQFSFEQKSQLMNQIQESVSSDLSLENYVWGLADQKKYPIVSADQITGGITYNRKNWLIDLDLYRKDIKNISSFLYGFFNRFDAEIHQGNGYVNGIDFLIQKSIFSWNASVTYAFLDAQNRYENINAHQYFPSNSAIQHAVNVNLSKKWDWFTLAAGWHWHTGKPYFAFDANNKITGFNDKTLPDYHRMDVSGIFKLNHQKKWKTSIGFSVLNVYNQKNILSKEYQRQYNSFESTLNNQLQLVEYYALNITPNVFFKISF